MMTRRGDDDGIRVLGSWSQANRVLAQAAPLGVCETVSGAGRFYRYVRTLITATGVVSSSRQWATCLLDSLPRCPRDECV
jgi:hypothetical protein